MIESRLGFCATYNATMLFESSALKSEVPSVMECGFCQYVFDNADHNINALNGQHTFHPCYTKKFCYFT